MAWIRRTKEAPERRTGDLVRCFAGVGGVVLFGWWAETPSNLSTNLSTVVNDLSDSLEGLAEWLYALGSIWAVVVLTIVVALLARGNWRIPIQVALAGGVAWAIAKLLNEIFGSQSLDGISIHVRTDAVPAFPSPNVAVITALAVVLAPFLTRPLRRLFFLLVPLVFLATLYLGAAFPPDAMGGLLLGVAAAALTLFVLGAPTGRPSVDEVRDALSELGIDVTDVRASDESLAGAAVVTAVLASGEQVRVDAFGRDQRDGQVAAKLGHRLMYHEPGVPVFGTRLQKVEQIAYALMLADRAGVHGPRLVKTGVAGADTAMLVTSAPLGQPLDELDPSEITDTVLAGAWRQADAMHDAGVSHGNLDAHHVLAHDGEIFFADFSGADPSSDIYWRRRDNASLLVATSFIVGNDRAISAATSTLGNDRVAELIPYLQPAALPSGVTQGQKHLGKTLKALRADLTTATGAEDIPPLKVQRLSLVNIGMLAGVLFAVALLVSGLEGVNWDSVKGEFENADWGYAALALMLYPLVPMAWATALIGCVNADIPFVPTSIVQLSCSFLNLITPNGIGGTALQLDYLHHQDVPLASGGSAMVLSTGVGGVIQMALFLIAASITATSVESSDSGSSITLGAVALVAALVGVVLWIPKIRNKVVPAVKRAANDIWSVVRNPKKALRLLGGDLAGNLVYPFLLGLCLLAFHQHLDYAQLIVVQVGAGMMGSVAPVPGGIGVQGAALLAGLTAFGIPTEAATATVIVYRAITFAIPALVGFFTLRWVRARGYA